MSRLESLASLPKVVAGAAGSALVGAASGAYQPPPEPAVHWMQLVVWGCTAFGGLAAGALAAVNGYVSVQRILSNRRRRLRYHRLKAEGKLPLP